MRVFELIADERRVTADLLSGLTAEQLRTPSLCGAWTVHDVGAHLIMPLETGIPAVLRALITSRGNLDRANLALTARQARRPVDQIVETLRRKAEHRFTPPGMGPKAPLTDLLVHGQDIRRPLGMDRQFPAEPILTSIRFLTEATPRASSVRGG